MKLIAFDPGQTTGYAVYRNYTWGGDPIRHLSADELRTDGHHKALYDLLEFAQPNVVVCEDFRYQRGPGGHNLSPVEYIGICKLWTQEKNVPLVLQNRDTKILWDNEKIKKCGLWQPGKPHAVDAIRHALYYITLTAGDNYYLRLLEP